MLSGPSTLLYSACSQMQTLCLRLPEALTPSAVDGERGGALHNREKMAYREPGASPSYFCSVLNVGIQQIRDLFHNMVYNERIGNLFSKQYYFQHLFDKAQCKSK